MKKEKEIKEEKEVKKDYSLEEKDQKRLKGISKAIYIIAKIIKIFAIIGIVGLLIAMLFVPICTANIKTIKGDEESVIKIFGNDIYYRRSDTSFELYEKGKEDNKTEVTRQSEVEAINKVFDYLEKNDLTKMTIFLEVEFAIFVAILFLQVKIFSKVYSFFKNIYESSTPFLKENIELLENIGKLLIISLILSMVASIVGSFVLNSTYTISVSGIMEILILYFGLYIFKYGYKLQTETKGKIYSE